LEAIIIIMGQETLEPQGVLPYLLEVVVLVELVAQAMDREMLEV
jgi:hypothetical protein